MEEYKFIRYEDTKVFVNVGEDYDYTFNPYDIDNDLKNLIDYKKATNNLKAMLRRSELKHEH
jgi:hypothetical protein